MQHSTLCPPGCELIAGERTEAAGGRDDDASEAARGRYKETSEAARGRDEDARGRSKFSDADSDRDGFWENSRRTDGCLEADRGREEVGGSKRARRRRRKLPEIPKDKKRKLK
jgi:hypothetical protein